MDRRSKLREIPPETAAADVDATPITALRDLSNQASSGDVDRALATRRRGLAEFAALISPAAAPRLEDLAQAAHELTVRRFGRAMRLYAPIYLSNECVSGCTYCGFSRANQVTRRTLTIEEADAEAQELARRGFRHILLVAGEQPRIASAGYLERACRTLAPTVPEISIETQVWDTDTYASLVAAGCDGVVVYQETYDREIYRQVHPLGMKRHYAWRLAALDRAAAAGMRRLGLASLIGLHPDWRWDAIAVAAHARALIRRWWRCEVAVSAPRIQAAAGEVQPNHPISDRDFVQYLCALRLTLPDVGLTLSTREAPALRDGLMRLGITAMSAGSHTEPGGYAAPSDSEPQFAVGDRRSPEEVVAALRSTGYDPVWKDWERV